jgi:hypothetical protein
LGGGHCAAATARVEIKMMKLLITRMSLMGTDAGQTVILYATQGVRSATAIYGFRTAILRKTCPRSQTAATVIRRARSA